MKWLLKKYSEDDIRQIREKDDLTGQTWGTLHSAVSVLVCIVPSNFFFPFFPLRQISEMAVVYPFLSLSECGLQCFFGGREGGVFIQRYSTGQQAVIKKK